MIILLIINNFDYIINNFDYIINNFNIIILLSLQEVIVE